MSEPTEDFDTASAEAFEPATKTESVVYQANRFLHWVGAAVLALMMTMTVVDVIGRKFFNHPFKGSIELTEVGLILLIFLSLGFAQHFGDHVSIDLIYERLPPRGRRVMAVAAGLVSTLIGLFMAWRLYLYADLLQTGGYETATWHIPLHLVALVGAFGCLTFVLAMATTVLRAFTAKEGAA